MKVKELLAKLRDADPDAEVVMENYGYDCCGIGSPDPLPIKEVYVTLKEGEVLLE